MATKQDETCQGIHTDSEGLPSSLEFSCARDYRSIERDPKSQLAPQHLSVGATTLVVPSGDEMNDCTLHDCKYFQNRSVLDRLVYFCALSVASYAGVVTRIYLANLQAWNGVPLFPSLYAELFGTALMGFITYHRKFLEKKHKLVYLAIATGLCGSITTFSSWNSEAAEVLLQVGRGPPDNAERIIGWFTVLVIGVGMPIAALLFGRHVAHLSPWSDGRLVEQEEYVQFRKCRNQTMQKVVFIAVWMCCTCVVLFLPFHYQQYHLMFSFLFCFVGTYTRWYLSPLNTVVKNFKLGTFLANVLGSWLLGGVVVVSVHFESQLSHFETAVLKGVSTGFCGCLTTVSTFAVELLTLSLSGSYVYGFMSLALAQVGLVAVRGAYVWTR